MTCDKKLCNKKWYYENYVIAFVHRKEITRIYYYHQKHDGALLRDTRTPHLGKHYCP